MEDRVYDVRVVPEGVTETERLREEKDGAYRERNQLVALLASLYPSSLERHPAEDASWDDEWRWVVYIDTPVGQLSWHLHDSHLPYFDHVPREEGRTWDGHTTPEKYERVRKLIALQREEDKR